LSTKIAYIIYDVYYNSRNNHAPCATLMTLDLGVPLL